MAHRCACAPRGAGGGRLSLRYRAAQARPRPTGVEHYSPSPRAIPATACAWPSAGGSVNTSLPNAAAWVPVSVVTRKDGSPGYMPHFIDRAKPASSPSRATAAASPTRARRITTSCRTWCAPARTAARSAPGWSATTRRCAYGLGSAAPFPMPIKRYLRTGYLLRGSSVAELAQRAGIDAGSLRQTVEAFNAEARLGRDPLHGKGSKATTVTRAMRCTAPPAWRPSNRDRTTRSRS